MIAQQSQRVLDIDDQRPSLAHICTVGDTVIPIITPLVQRHGVFGIVGIIEDTTEVRRGETRRRWDFGLDEVASIAARVRS
jgi:hypothetical protein